MIYLIISGPPRVGKTPALVNLTTELTSRRGFTVTDGTFPPVQSQRDILCLVEGLDNTGRHVKIIINSATDLHALIDDLWNFYQKHPDVDMIFTSSRHENDPERHYLFNRMQINLPGNDVVEIPRGRMITGYSRAAAVPWFQATMQQHILHTLRWPPFSLL